MTLPDAALQLALKLVDASATSSSVEVFVDDEHLVLEQTGLFRVDVDRIAANFPDFRQCLPNLNSMVIATFDSRAMRDALETAAPFISKSEAARVVYNGSVQVVVDGDAGTFDADLAGDHTGESVTTLSFNRKYLAAACSTLGDVPFASTSPTV